jgi:hypothetical protein
MKLKLVRETLLPTRTLGKLYVNGEYFCDTAEDKDRFLEKNLNGKIPKLTAIPRGIYKVVLSLSNRFKKVLPEVLNVPVFSGVRIHSGNTEEDTEGCILVGKRIGDSGVFESRKTMDRLMTTLKDTDTIELEVQ